MLAKHRQIEVELDRFLSEIRTIPPELPPQVRQVLLYVHEHLFNPDLNVNIIKARCSLRDNNITMRFRHHVGVGLRDYVERLRLEAADRLLRSGSYPVYLVAMSVGYSHQETFCRAFARRFDCPPSDRCNGKPWAAGPEKRSRDKIMSS
jgi:transcriptional regulator GlxA family with amidase domain